MDIIEQLSKDLNLKSEQINSVLNLLNDGATVPFIARYRKEVTNGLDEDQIREIEKEWQYRNNLLKRKEDVIRLIDEKGLLTDTLKNKIMSCNKLIDVEDLYLPYKEKKKTKATMARALGLEPLAKLMLSLPININKEDIVEKYITDKVKTYEDAVSKASDIIAENVSDNADYRKIIRNNLHRSSFIVSKLKKNAVDTNNKYENYYEYQESINTIKNHRILAINRAEKEKILAVSIEGDTDRNLNFLYKQVIYKNTDFYEEIKKAIDDSYKRLIFPSLEREIRNELTLKAETDAIDVFSLNLKNLLLQPPLKDKMVLGVDPAFRTGCKLAVVDRTGKMLEIGVIYPNQKRENSTVDSKDLINSKKTFISLCKKYDIEIITIGNGTASRETESFVATCLKEGNLKAKYVIVSEAGASVYSASKIAQEEFPDLSLEKRSAVSIARRIQDPLSELVKIDPKSIGVGQYQHDVNAKSLDAKLAEVVGDSVNSVGIDLNTASISLLTYVSGLNKSIASNIIDFRNEVGKFKSRKELLKVKKLGNKTYEQCVGFLRVYDGINKLDSTPIHPESYKVAENLIKYFDITINDLGKNEIKDKISRSDRKILMDKFDVDKYTLDDILKSFVQPVRDIRDDFKTPLLKSNQVHLEDLNVGDELEGTVRNVVDFGVFVDCGLHEDGLVHISKMSHNYIKHPSDLVKVGDIIKVYVIGIDLKKSKLALSMEKDLI